MGLLGGILTIWAAVAKYCRLDGLETEMYCSYFWRLGSQRSRHQHDLILVSSLFLFHSGHLIVSLRIRRGLGVSFRGALTHSWGLYPHDLVTSQRPPPSNTITLGIIIPTCESGRDANMQTIAGGLNSRMNIKHLFILSFSKHRWNWSPDSSYLYYSLGT